MPLCIHQGASADERNVKNDPTCLLTIPSPCKGHAVRGVVLFALSDDWLEAVNQGAKYLFQAHTQSLKKCISCL